MNNCVFNRETGCACLKVKQCMIGKPCSFKKTEAELIEGREKAARRIASLPVKERLDIAEKYYSRGGSGTTQPVEDTGDDT
jgi:hypothetical protein